MKEEKFPLEEIKKDKNYSFYKENSDKRIKLAQKIEEKRKEAGLTQKELAKKTRTTQSIISEIESADYNVGFELFSRIVVALNMDSHFLGEVFDVPIVVNNFSFEVEDSFQVEDNYETEEDSQETGDF